jgi:DNA-binding PadR family transcriptional regulator
MATGPIRPLGKKYSAEILTATTEPCSARELSEELDIPIATSYRRIEELLNAGLLALDDLEGKATALEEGNLDTEIESDRKDEIGTFYGAFAGMRDSLKDRISKAEQATEDAEQAANVSGETTVEAEDVAAAAEEQTAALTEVTETTEEQSRQADELSDMVGQFDTSESGTTGDLDRDPSARSGDRAAGAVGDDDGPTVASGRTRTGRPRDRPPNSGRSSGSTGTSDQRGPSRSSKSSEGRRTHCPRRCTGGRSQPARRTERTRESVPFDSTPIIKTYYVSLIIYYYPLPTARAKRGRRRNVSLAMIEGVENGDERIDRLLEELAAYGVIDARAESENGADVLHESAVASDSGSEPAEPRSVESVFAGSGTDFSFDDAIIKENLEAILLGLISVRGGAHGKALMGDLARFFDAELSPGTVYPRLHDLEAEGLLQVHELVRTKEYTIDDETRTRERIERAMGQHVALGAVFRSSLGGAGSTVADRG